MMIRDCRLLIELHHIYRRKYWESMPNRAARISKYKMINFDDVTNENKNRTWSKVAICSRSSM